MYLQRKRLYNTEGIEYPFEFQPETAQKTKRLDNKKKGFKRRVDIGIRINTYDLDMELVYCLEAKKLPTDSVGGKREKEYVLGNFGGINRFKMNQHGVTDEGDPITKNGIVAYILTQDDSHWFNKINTWISVDTNWGSNELLTLIYSESIIKLESSHLRVNGDTVELNHYWIVLV